MRAGRIPYGPRHEAAATCLHRPPRCQGRPTMSNSLFCVAAANLCLQINWEMVATRSRVANISAARDMHPFLVQLEEGTHRDVIRPKVDNASAERRATDARPEGNAWLRDDPFIEKGTSNPPSLPSTLCTTGRVCPVCGPLRSWRCICSLTPGIDYVE